jgi:hypothetical protein
LRLSDNLRLHGIATVVVVADATFTRSARSCARAGFARQLAFRAESELKEWRGEGFVPCLLIIGFAHAAL